jgi:hypothetical protein
LQYEQAPLQNSCTECSSAAAATEIPHSSSLYDVFKEEEKQNEPESTDNTTGSKPTVDIDISPWEEQSAQLYRGYQRNEEQ